MLVGSTIAGVGDCLIGVFVAAWAWPWFVSSLSAGDGVIVAVARAPARFATPDVSPGVGEGVSALFGLGDSVDVTTIVAVGWMVFEGVALGVALFVGSVRPLDVKSVAVSRVTNVGVVSTAAAASTVAVRCCKTSELATAELTGGVGDEIGT